MCGFAGLLDFSRSTDRDGLVDRATRMAGAIAHRGPDGAGVWVDPTDGIALAHRRLAVLDPTPAGAQPMLSESERFVIAYNGETYNFREMAEELAREGARIRSRCDTEVLLASIELRGVRATLERASGMLAFALWDRRDRRLVLARDRFGKKPLYFGWSNGRLAFGSELSALEALEGFGGEIDRDALALYMRHNCIPAPRSIYRGVFKLPPGCCLAVGPESRPFHTAEELAERVERYWCSATEAARAAASPFPGTGEEAVDELEVRLERAVRARLVSDVPIGAFLSGGIDSALIVTKMQAVSATPVRTFTIGSSDAIYDESSEAREIAARLGTLHTELSARPEEALELIPTLGELYAEPFADSSQIPTLLVSRLARRHVTVVLSGDGGDELFGGYNRHRVAGPLWDSIARWPLVARRAGASLLTSVSPATWDRLMARLAPCLPTRARLRMAGYKAHKLARLLPLRDRRALYRSLASHWHEPDEVVRGACEPPTRVTDPDAWPDLPTFEEQMMLLDVETYLPDDILTKVDRASMSVGLEARAPYLDPDVARFAWSLPLALKIRDGVGKWPLRRLLGRTSPETWLRRPKGGFGVPLGDWLRGPLRDWVESLLSPRRLREDGFFDPVPVLARWEEHRRGVRDWQYELWDVLMFQAWRARTVEPESPRHLTVVAPPRSGVTPVPTEIVR